MTDKQEFNSVYGDIAGRDVVHHTTVQIAQQTIIYQYGPVPPAAPPQQPAQVPSETDVWLENFNSIYRGAEAAQKPPELTAKKPLRQLQTKLIWEMKALSNSVRSSVVAYMRREFGTGKIRELDMQALDRTYCYVCNVRVLTVKGKK